MPPAGGRNTILRKEATALKRILILGGGASGIVAAIAAAEAAPPDTRVVLLEKNPRIGKKLLATGNGRCNLDNDNIHPDCFFTTDRGAMSEMLAAMGQPLEWFRRHGLLCRSDEAGRVYPYSNQAADVLNLLLHWLETAGVEVRTECAVSTLRPKDGRWAVTLESGETIGADAVICAMGGSAGPQFGTDGLGIRLAEALGCDGAPQYPCLVSLQCRKAQVAGLSGIRAKADAALYDGERFIHKESGEIQFTDYGLSGIAVMQLSGYLAPNSGIRKPEIRLDLFPHLTEADLTAVLQTHGRALPHVTAGDFMTGLIHRRLGLAVWKAQKLGDEQRLISTLKAEEWLRLAQGFKAWRFTELENTGWKNAQTTGGGIRLHQLERDTFMVKQAPGLYIVGETTDCAGSCGGFNLHWAFGSGILAGEAAARQLGGKPGTAPRSPAKSAPAHRNSNRSVPRTDGKNAPKTAPKNSPRTSSKQGAPAGRQKPAPRTKDGKKSIQKPANHKKRK